MKKRGRHRIRSAEYWRAYYAQKQREWRAAHPRARRRRKQKIVDWPSLPTHEESLFLRQNDYWTIRYHGHTALLKSTRGLHYLAVLLRDPGREFHVRELLARPMDVSTPAAVVAAHGRVTGGLYDGVPVLDAQAKAEYKCRVNDLRQDLNQAKRFNDPQRKTEVQNELQAIADHLAFAVGLGAGTARLPRTPNERVLP